MVGGQRLGQRASEGHTEQKAAARIDFDVMREQGYSLTLVGDYRPCAWARGCDLMLHDLAVTYEVPILYKDFDDEQHAYGPAYSE